MHTRLRFLPSFILPVTSVSGMLTDFAFDAEKLGYSVEKHKRSIPSGIQNGTHYRLVLVSCCTSRPPAFALFASRGPTRVLSIFLLLHKLTFTCFGKKRLVIVLHSIMFFNGGVIMTSVKFLLVCIRL